MTQRLILISVMAHLLPPITENYNPGLDPNALNDVEDDNSVLINVDQVKEALKNAGKDVEQFGSSLLPTLPVRYPYSSLDQWLLLL